MLKQWPKVCNKDCTGNRLSENLIHWLYNKNISPQINAKRESNLNFVLFLCDSRRKSKNDLYLLFLNVFFLPKSKFCICVKFNGVHWNTIPIKVYKAFVEIWRVLNIMSIINCLISTPLTAPRYLNICVCLNLWPGLQYTSDQGRS